MDASLFREYLVNYNKGNKLLSDGTIVTYMDVIKRFLKYTSDVYNPQIYNNFLIKFVVKKSMYHYHYALKHYIKWKVTDTNLQKQILKNLICVELKDKKTPSSNLSKEQIDKIIDNLSSDKFKLIARLQRECGARISDVLWLKSDNIQVEFDNDNNKVVSLLMKTKGERYNITYLYDTILQKELIEYKDKYSNKIMLKEDKLDKVGVPISEDYVFLVQNKTRKSLWNNNLNGLMRVLYRKYWTDLKIACKNAKVNYKLWATHDFRRDFSRRTYEKYGKDIYLLKELLNHQRIDTTARYLKTSGLYKRDTLKDFQQKKVRILKADVIPNTKIDDVIYIGNDMDRETVDKYIKDKVFKYE